MSKKEYGILILFMAVVFIAALYSYQDGSRGTSTATAVSVPTKISTAIPSPSGTPLATIFPTDTAVPTIQYTNTPAPTKIAPTAEKTANPVTSTVIPTPTTATPQLYVVEQGDTMSQIYFDHCGDAVGWPIMCEANGMLEPYSCHQIWPGDVIELVCKDKGKS